MKRVVVALLGLLSVVACTSKPLEFADWTIPVPAGARIIEYDDPTFEDREGRIKLVEDLVVGARREDPDYLLYQPLGVAVDAAGRMYVADAGYSHVQVFGADGEHLRTLGREGQGPGELQVPTGVVIVGDRVVVCDWGNRRHSVWDLEGVFLGEIPMSVRMETMTFGTEAGSMVGAMNRWQYGVIDIALFSIEGTELVHYVSLPNPRDLSLRYSGGSIVMTTVTPDPSWAVAASGEVYVTAGDEYQVLAFAASGSPLWALRAARQRQVAAEEPRQAPLRASVRLQPWGRNSSRQQRRPWPCTPTSHAD